MGPLFVVSRMALDGAAGRFCEVWGVFRLVADCVCGLARSLEGWSGAVFSHVSGAVAFRWRNHWVVTRLVTEVVIGGLVVTLLVTVVTFLVTGMVTLGGIMVTV
jgi:hypothetical protein